MDNAIGYRAGGRALRRVLVLFTVCALGAVASASVGHAEVVTNQQVSYAWSGFVPCAAGGAGEVVTGTIDVHDMATSTVNGNVDVWQFQFQPRGSFVGKTTGDTYRLTGVTRGTYAESLQSDRYTMTYVNSYQLIGPGPENNLRIREIAHVTVNDDEVIVQHDDLTIDCA
jgi:hypothetical protein